MEVSHLKSSESPDFASVGPSILTSSGATEKKKNRIKDRNEWDRLFKTPSHLIELLLYTKMQKMSKIAIFLKCISVTLCSSTTYVTSTPMGFNLKLMSRHLFNKTHMYPNICQISQFSCYLINPLCLFLNSS